MKRCTSIMSRAFRGLAASVAITAAGLLPGCIMGPNDAEFGQQLAKDYPLGITERQLIQSLDRDGIPRTMAETNDSDDTRRVFADFQGNSMVNRYVEFTLVPSHYSNSGMYFHSHTASAEHRSVLRGYRVWHAHEPLLRTLFDPEYFAKLHESSELPSGVQRFDGPGYCWYIAPADGDVLDDEDKLDEEVDIGAMALVRITWPTDKPHATTTVPIPAELASVEIVGIRVIVGPSIGAKRFVLNPRGTVLLEGDHVARELNTVLEPEGHHRQIPTALLLFDDVLTPQELVGETLTFTFRPEAN